MDTRVEEQDEGVPPDDERESCLMCGACETMGQVCVLTASLRKE